MTNPYPKGVILALHPTREKGDFTVVKRVLGTEYPPVDIQKVISDHLKAGYMAVWFQETTVPDTDNISYPSR